MWIKVNYAYFYNGVVTTPPTQVLESIQKVTSDQWKNFKSEKTTTTDVLIIHPEGDMIVHKTSHDSPFNTCWVISLWTIKCHTAGGTRWKIRGSLWKVKDSLSEEHECHTAVNLIVDGKLHLPSLVRCFWSNCKSHFNSLSKYHYESGHRVNVRLSSSQIKVRFN